MAAWCIAAVFNGTASLFFQADFGHRRTSKQRLGMSQAVDILTATTSLYSAKGRHGGPTTEVLTNRSQHTLSIANGQVRVIVITATTSSAN
jgi:hypothetical protein